MEKYLTKKTVTRYTFTLVVMSSLDHRKPVVDLYLDPIYTAWIHGLDSGRIYKGYAKILDSRKRVWWSDLQVHPEAVFQDPEEGDFFLESSNTLYRVVFQESTPEMEAHPGSRFLPPLSDVLISDDGDIIRGYDSGISERIMGEIYSETDDWFEVALKMDSKRVGIVKYLK